MPAYSCKAQLSGVFCSALIAVTILLQLQCHLSRLLLTQAYGAGKLDAVGLWAQRCWLICMLACLPICAAWLAAEPLLLLAGQTQQVSGMTAAYLRHASELHVLCAAALHDSVPSDHVQSRNAILWQPPFEICHVPTCANVQTAPLLKMPCVISNVMC